MKILVGLLLLILLACTGPSGLQGSKGDTGNQGADGASCTIVQVPNNEFWPNGGAYIVCGALTAFISNGVTGAQGPQGLPGLNGLNGAAGLQGSPGVNGQDGRNGTVITPIQFCPGVIPSYPSTFPEIGFVIGTDIYGVYSANGGFMVWLPPGRYSSDGINASCTFTVNSDGTVSK